ncbi:MAG: ATP-binding cassette domain-containing protein [Saprospiraceae bacterium]|nr:ATP-binding cassette domain-containing protein [Saprospiraceae bacterium]
MIEIKSLSKSYGKKQVLRQINLQFERGKVYGIVGENGAGKTTLFTCLAGLNSFDEGEIRTDVAVLKDILGFLPTSPYFFSRMTGGEYLKLLTVARGIDVDKYEEKNIFDLPLNEYAETYSTGMKKKLALLGILLQKNEVFILDEPFNGVDIHSNIMITEIIHRLKAQNKTVLISSHIFSTLNDTCDEIFMLRDGVLAGHYKKRDFGHLEMEMKQFVIGNRLEGIGL